jgi:hypothetical protein
MSNESKGSKESKVKGERESQIPASDNSQDPNRLNADNENSVAAELNIRNEPVVPHTDGGADADVTPRNLEADSDGS